MTRRIRLAFALIAMVVANEAAHAAGIDQDDAKAAIVRLIPSDAIAAVIVPNLKNTSWNFTRLLEGMDRANLLMGSRPIDLAKSVMGYAAAVDDEGSAAFVILPSDDATFRSAWIVPVTDAAGFLEAGFTEVEEGEPNAHRGIDGTVVYSRVLAKHVVLSEQDATLKAWELTGGIDSAPLVADIDPFLQSETCDVVVALGRPVLARIAGAIEAQAGRLGLAVPFRASAILDQCQSLVIAAQCDPLALIVRSELRFADGSAIAAKIADNADESRNVDVLPAQSFAFAVTIDTQAIGGRTSFDAVRAALAPDAAPFPSWLDQIDAFACGIAPGPNAALLSDSAIVLRSAAPGMLRDDVEKTLRAEGRDVTIELAKLMEGRSSPQAFTIRPLNASSPLAVQSLIESLLFGAAGAKGFVQVNDDSLIATFAQRPALLAQYAKPAERIGESPASQIMRQWMPMHRDIEGYIGASQAATMLKSAANVLRQPLPTLPAFDEHAPPISFACDATKRACVGSIIVPAGVLAPISDEIARWIQMRDNAP